MAVYDVTERGRRAARRLGERRLRPLPQGPGAGDHAARGAVGLDLRARRLRGRPALGDRTSASSPRPPRPPTRPTTTWRRCAPGRAARSGTEPAGYAAAVSNDQPPSRRHRPVQAAAEAADRLRELTGVDKHDVALVMGSGWLPAVDALGRGHRRAAAPPTCPGFAPPAVAGHAGQDPLGARRATATCWCSSAAPTSTRAVGVRVRGARRAHRRRRRLRGGRAHQRLRRPQGVLAAGHPGADQRPPQPDRHLAHRGRQLRRPHRPLQQPAARAVPRGRPLPRRGRLRAVPRPALRDPRRDPDGARDGRGPGRHVDGRSRRSPRARPGWRCSASRWSPTSPPASPASRSTTRRSSRPGAAAATRMGELLGAVVPRI